ncbi:MAG TPA: exosome complex RNA-binding protein Csl4 [Nitrososphaerales archaeon]|nr:exosome complex RNA-binding protein Csl4 [Nitrososphaerales archaeon]
MSNKREMEKKPALPGDFLAYPEEFLPGANTYERGDAVRARLPGVAEKDLSKREVSVRPSKVAKAPKVGDVVVGQVEAAMTSTAGVRITWLNGVEVAGFPGTIFTRTERGGRGERRTYVKLADVVRAKVASTLNGMNQLSIDEPHLGVLAALCTVCGTPLPRGDGRSRCENCGNVEERKFADDFGTENIKP